MPTARNSFLPSLALVGGACVAWLSVVASHVSGPYLDEYFHVRQAEQYWNGNWHVWDPKITTPPGLYVVSWAWLFVLSFIKLDLVTKLRSINGLIGVPAIFATAHYLLDAIHRDELAPQQPLAKPSATVRGRPSRAGFANIARNVAFFPPLFFFSGLYYTDVISVLAVLVTYEYFHDHNTLGVISTGLISLTFRQNNIFWCAVFLGGLEVARSLKRNEIRHNLVAYSDIPAILNESWTRGEYYDPSVDRAGIEDYILCAATIAIAALVNINAVLPRLVPYITLLASFGAFVLWNGGVVLGDKSNHVASLHLPQMLYIWPYFAFFSFAAMIPGAALRVDRAFKSPQPLQVLSSMLPRPLILLGALTGSAAAVRFNTIIHPFTLADNRHFTFYIFRLLRLYPFLKYAAIPVYIVCAWGALTALGSTELLGSSSGSVVGSKSTKNKDGSRVAPQTSSSMLAQQGNRTSFVLVWLIASALGLITAPLVEPRYFILPWIIWRLHVPAYDVKPGDGRPSSLAARVAAWAPWIETAWVLLVNAATMWIFINWAFEWKQEPGALQRFMW